MPPPVTPIRPETATPPPVKRGRGRPPAPPKDFDFSATKQVFRSTAEFERFINGYPHTQATIGYIWRVNKPKIDLGLIGAKHTHIHKTADLNELTRAHVAERWGRGVYMLRFNDENLKGEQEVAKCIVDIDDADARPPVYDINTLVLNDPANADEVARQIALGVLERLPGGVIRVKTSEAYPAAVAPIAPPVAPPAPVLSPTASMLETLLLPRLLERFLDQPVSPPAAGNSIGSLSEILALVDRLQSQRHVPAVAPNPDHEFEVWERVNARLERLGIGRESGGSEEPAWVKVISDMLGPLVPLGAQFLMQKLQGGDTAGAAQVRSVTENGVTELGRGSAGTSQAVPPPSASMPSLLPESAPFMDRVTQVVELALDKLTEGVPGLSFGGWLVAFYPGGRELLTQLQSTGGPKACLSLVGMVPALKIRVQEIITADPRNQVILENWLTDLFSYDDEPEAEAEAA